MAQVQTADATASVLYDEKIDLRALSDPVTAALDADKREGLLLAVRARWVALVVIALFLPYVNPTWGVLYYEAMLVGFALIGWAQIKAGRLGASKRELALVFCDLALMTFIQVVPNPFMEHEFPAAMQYHFGSFKYFFVLLAGATMAYSWRTVFAVGTWTSGLWIGGLIWISFQPPVLPEVSQDIQVLLANHPNLLKFLDPNDVRIPGRVEEILVFLIVAGILALGGRRTSRLLRKQAEVARERANLARHFPPNIVDQLAIRDQPLGAVRDQDVAVMFVDIVGFTKLAEKQTAGQVVGTLREFHARMERAVFDHDGTLDKFLGDGLMATFGTPEPGPQDASNALACAQTMIAAMDVWNRERQAMGAEVIRISIGLHYGGVVLGDIGSDRRLEFAVLGDAVNVASRLEGLTRRLDVRVAVSDDLIERARGEAAEEATGETDELLAKLTSVGPQDLRGRDEPIVVWAR
ncbi:MAG: adenylate/guanylate cyclase domain-containing protein [Rhodospirillaceae bacterium]|nr:adenylate/guanylate cyclase domain-containing protein [Rhodospirillaceae bacterium]